MINPDGVEWRGRKLLGAVAEQQDPCETLCSWERFLFGRIPMRRDWRKWSPFQSEDVRRICGHLSEPETTRLQRRAAMYGVWVAATFAVPLGAAIAYPGLYTLIVAAVLILIHIACIPLWLAKQRSFLCSTRWAREQGFTPDTLHLFSFGRPDTHEPTDSFSS